MDRVVRLMNSPMPVRNMLRTWIRQLGLGSYAFRRSIGAVDRPHYSYLVFHAAQLARRLGIPQISVIEYGVAGGQGLLSLEHHASEVERLFGVTIDVYGFDTGAGLPKPIDHRDLPYHWKEGFFAMNPERQRERLRRARLVLGDIGETSRTFFQQYRPAPIGAIIHDFDYYSSTRVALTMLHAGHEFYLPRILAYFDDTIGGELELYNDYTGERLAIREFNAANDDIKLCAAYHLVRDRPEVWHHQIWTGHFFKHPRYSSFASDENQQLTI